MIYDNPELIARQLQQQRQEKAIQKLMQRKPSIPVSQRVNARQEPQVEITPTRVSKRLEREQYIKEHKFRGFKNVRQSNYKKAFTSTGAKPSTKVQSAFLKAFAGVQPKSQSKGSRAVGRPRAVFKHISQLTGKPVPAQVYNKEMRFIRRRQSDIATQRQLQIQQQMARRGITPQQSQQIELQRQLQQMQARQMPTQQVIARPMPQAGRVIPSQQPSIWRRQGYIAEEVDILGNRRQVVRGTPQAFWN